MFRVALIGATGLVGDTLLTVMQERAFPVRELHAYASERSVGKEIEFQSKTWSIRSLRTLMKDRPDVAFFAGDTEDNMLYARELARQGCLVIDNTSTLRMEPDVPLCVMGVNDNIRAEGNLVANPNCSTIQLAIALNPLKEKFGIERVHVATYQSVSGGGRALAERMRAETRAILDGGEPEGAEAPVGLNLVPAIGSLDPEGYYTEETKVTNELRKIFSAPDLPVSCTAVRVPVEVSHSEDVLAILKKEATVDDIRAAFAGNGYIELMDDPAGGLWPTPRVAAGSDKTFVGRVRKDRAFERGVLLWVVADNLRVGAAANAVAVALCILEARGLSK